MKSYIVIGLGRFGEALARQLCMLGQRFWQWMSAATLCSRWRTM